MREWGQRMNEHKFHFASLSLLKLAWLRWKATGLMKYIAVRNTLSPYYCQLAATTVNKHHVSSAKVDSTTALIN